MAKCFGLGAGELVRDYLAEQQASSPHDVSRRRWLAVGKIHLNTVFSAVHQIAAWYPLNEKSSYRAALDITPWSNHAVLAGNPGAVRIDGCGVTFGD